jgi:cell division protease FtsH
MNPNNKSGQKTRVQRQWLLVSILAALLVLALIVTLRPAAPPATVSLSELARSIAAGRVVRIDDTATSGELLITFADGSTAEALRDPATSLVEQLHLLGVETGALAAVQLEVQRAVTRANPAGVMLILALAGGAAFFTVRTKRGERWGKKTYAESDIPALRFDDVAGLDENVQELRDIVTFLREGDRYAEMGAKMPRGVLMVGDPGTGKTLIAKAVAGEAGVPFFATSGSEFTEVFVGVGAGRIRALFQKARKKAPCIIFIDEIDAVGRARHRSESGAEMEQDQTLNQLLVEMDGFSSGENIIVLAATNREDVLDSALTRAGRFDRRVYVGRPDVRGREAILNIHVQGKRLADDVVLTNVAKATPGLVGADLANIVNEAAISAVRQGHPAIAKTDFDEAVEKNLAGGVAHKNRVMTEEERRIIAYHEAGHAVVMHLTPSSDPVYKITIIPRGQTGGYTMALPENDSILTSRGKLLSRITGLLGGRAAEEIFFQEITSGASNDLNVATQLAEEMVMHLGMDPRAGLRTFTNAQARTPFAQLGSQKTYESIDEAVNTILETCYAEARRLLTEKAERVHALAAELLEVETIDRARFEALMGAAHAEFRQ